jgi:predicted dehydrogenase
MSSSLPVLKVGVVGVGALGKHHARLHAANPGAMLVGVHDANPAVAAEVAALHETTAFATVEELAAACDGLSIAVPADLHHQVAAPLLRQGKHLLIEKPIATAVADAEDMVRLAREHRAVLAIGHVERYNPVMSFFEKMQEKIRFIEVHRLAPYPPERPGMHRRGTEVSVILDLMIHDLEIIQHLVGEPVTEIHANGFPALSATEDVANARLLFANGCVANVTASRIAPGSMRKFRIFYADSYVSLDYGERAGLMYEKDPAAAKVVRTPIPVNDHNALEKELDDFVACARHALAGEPPPDTRVSGIAGLEALRLAIAIEENIRAFNRQYGFFTESYR